MIDIKNEYYISIILGIISLGLLYIENLVNKKKINSEDYLKLFISVIISSALSIYLSKMISIENFVDKKNYLNKPNLKRKKIILSVGRIADQKNYSTLIKAFHVFNQKKREWKLVIIGEGYDKKKALRKSESLYIQLSY